jgi:hypothetical protein
MPEDKKCCGFNTDNERVTYIGAITLAYPLFLLSALCFILSLPLDGLMNTGFAPRALGVWRASLKLINSKLTVSFRRTLAAGLFRASPRFAGFFYKYLNICLITLLWSAGVCLIGFLR